MATAKQPLEKIPGFSIGVRENAAVRMIKLARPICPNSKLKMVKDSDGKWVPDEHQELNCQLAGGRWWEQCEALGHEPYFTKRRWYEVQDRIEVEEDGTEVVIGQKRIPHTTRYPNIAQVSASIRHNSGKGAAWAVERKGFKRLGEIGFEEVCQFRNCQRPLTDAGKSVQYGNYCSREHLMLVAANEQSVMLYTPTRELSGPDYEGKVRERRKQLREAVADVG